MLILTRFGGGGASGGGASLPVPYTFAKIEADSVDQSAFTFAGVSLGTAAADRVVVVAAHGSRVSAATSSISSITAGGVTLTNHASRSYAYTSRRSITVRSGIVPTGSSGDVVVTFSASHSHCMVAVWVLNGLSSTTPNDVGSADNYASGGISLSGVTVPTSGYGMYFADIQDRSFASWSNAVDLGGAAASSGSNCRAAEINPGAGSAPTVTLNGSGSTGYHGIVGISFV